LIRLINSKDILFYGPRLLTPAAVFLQIEGAASEAITVDGGDIRKASKSMVTTNGAQSKSVRLRT